MEEKLHPLFAKDIRFVAGAAKLEQIPEFSLPEVAFIGRSNAGKSSLLNALVNRNSLARTSSTPGHTRQLNFFNLADTLMLVDVPGYGYAKAPKKDVGAWQRTLFAYLRGRRQLARAFVLIDARHGVKEADQKMLKLLNDAAVSFQLVLTKADLIPASTHEAAREKAEVQAARQPAAHPHVLLTSSAKKMGMEGLRLAVLEAARLADGA